MKLNDSAIRAVLTKRQWNHAKCRPLLPAALMLWMAVCAWMFVLLTK